VSGHFDIEHVAPVPRGWRVRTRLEGRHELRIAFPPGPRRTGAGKVVEVLHPKGEQNPCPLANPAELVIFGNPKRSDAWYDGYRAGAAQARRGSIGEPPDMRGQLGEKAAKEYAAGYKAGQQQKTTRSMPNPDDTTGTDQAVRLFEIFHGRPAEEILEEQRSAAMRRDYTVLGDLDYILVAKTNGGHARLDFEGDGVKLACSPNGRQLYLIGGAQALDREQLADFTEDPSKDLIDLGEALEVEYVARKVHGNFEPIAWYHQFGEEKDGSELPRLLYDRLKKEIFFAGGEYYVDDTRDISPGIEN